MTMTHTKNAPDPETFLGNGHGSTNGDRWQVGNPITCASCVHQLFEAWAAKEPNRIAVSSSRGELTYGELNSRASLVGEQLRAIGVGPETVVGLCAPRSAGLLVGALGILKAGGAYLPIDPSEPGVRSEAILTDADVS